MPARTAQAQWSGTLLEGKGTIALGSGAFSGSYDWRSRSADGAGTNPEELIAGAHAGCFSMALSAVLTGHGHTVNSIHTSATVHLDKDGDGFSIKTIELTTEAEIPGISEEDFQKYATEAKLNCPVSKVLAGANISLTATVKSA